MSGGSDVMAWVETTEEVVVTEESPPSDDPTPPVLEPAEATVQKLLDTLVKEENPEANNGLHCEECLTLFQEPSDPANINGPSFVLDFPLSIGVPQRALLTLPYGLMIGRSSIPSAGVGVINHGPAVCPGMHFGPYEGEVTTIENALSSDFSWEINKGEHGYEYITAARESHSNWMRFVNCARNKDESNLLAVQFKGNILFHCCRTIRPGDELMVWPSDKLLANFSESWSQLWFMKLKSEESNTSAASQIFLCSQCQLSFTTEVFLQRHIEHVHAQPTGDCATPDAQGAVLKNPTPGEDSKTCADCGKTFKQMPHLRRHRLSVHSNRRPYCCPTCRRTFSQACGLIRHQFVHAKRTLPKDANQSKDVSEETGISTQSSEPVVAAGQERLDEAKENQQEAVDVTEAPNASTEEAEPAQFSCPHCVKIFTSEVTLKKHKMIVHEKIRPYVCTVCQRCFGQYNDLARHLQVHRRKKKTKGQLKKAAEKPKTLSFSSADCSLAFPSEDTLQQYTFEYNSGETTVKEGNLLPVDSDQINDPDFVPQTSVAKTDESLLHTSSHRPQRLGARSRISAITKLIASKQRRGVRAQPVASAVRNVKFTKYKWFSCERCKRTYGNSSDLKSHKCVSKQHKCGQCGASFSKSGFLKRHEQRVHVNAKSYRCDHCDKVFTTSCNLKQHQKSKTCMKYHCTSELFSCSFCQFSFTVKSYLIKHIKRHHPVEYLSVCKSDSLTDQLQNMPADKERVCPHCGKSCANAKAFKSHACFQQMSVLYLCPDCGRRFTNHYGLKQHQRVHTGEKPHRCPHCTKSFAYTGQLNVHLRTHTGEKPYLCTHCGESFRQSGDLKRHERKHTGVKPYTCTECSKSFSRPHSLKAHQMLHMGQKLFSCTQCGKSFSRNYHLRRHHQKMHS